MVKEKLAHDYVTNHDDSEVRRMYSHHYRSFIAGFNSSEAQKTTINEILKQFRDWTRENLDKDDIVTQKAVDRYLEAINNM